MTKLADCQVVGALTLPEGKAPFDRAPLIMSSAAAPGRVVQVTAYLEDGGIAGKWFTLEDFQALQQSGQAIAFRESFDAGSSAALWVLRPNFAGREAALAELRSSELMLRDYVPLADGSFGCLVRERAQASDLRDKWAKEADAEARQNARAGSWQRAREAASRALALERAMSPERIAMMMLACQSLGLGVRAEGYLRMARQSRGEDFAAQTEVALQKLEVSVSGQAVVPATSLLGPRKPAQGARQHVRDGLGRLRTSSP